MIMKRHLYILIVGLAGSLGPGMFPARADLEVSASVSINARADFYQPLAPHGVWVEVGSYGRCWRPAHVEVGWRPYCDGHWEWTDCGWYWVSDEPWAWACYHYGSWVYDAHHAWIWVPGVEWAPAWVSWRVGGGYIGWAPLPPHHVRLAPTFVFVETRRFREPVRPSTVVINNTTIIQKTRVISDVRREQRNIAGHAQEVVINEGPGVEQVQKATGQKIRATPIQEAVRRTQAPSSIGRRSRDGKVLSTDGKDPVLSPGHKPSSPARPDAPKTDVPGQPKKPEKFDRRDPPHRKDINPPSRETPPPPPSKPGKKPPKKKAHPDHGKGHGRDGF
jgi:hypothetical protein